MNAGITLAQSMSQARRAARAAVAQDQLHAKEDPPSPVRLVSHKEARGQREKEERERLEDGNDTGTRAARPHTHFEADLHTHKHHHRGDSGDEFFNSVFGRGHERERRSESPHHARPSNAPMDAITHKHKHHPQHDGRHAHGPHSVDVPSPHVHFADDVKPPASSHGSNSHTTRRVRIRVVSLSLANGCVRSEPWKWSFLL